MGGIDRTKNWEKVIMHVDMDAFFAAFETRNLPKLKGKPVIVGGDPRYRSVVSTCSYEAREFGVHSGMPIKKAKQLCPQAVIISGTLRGYVYTSAQLQKIFANYAPNVQPLSVDEVVMDITGCHRIFGTVENLVAQMKAEIKKELSLTCSAGIAPVKILAKMASGENKPDGLTIIDVEDYKKMFYPRPVDAIWGIGEATKKSLEKIGLKTVGDIAKKSEKELKAYFGKYGTFLYLVSQGRGNTGVYSLDERPNEKSMSHETTLTFDISDIDKIYSTLLWLSDKVSRRLRIGNYLARTITVKVRSSDFKTITRDKTVSHPTDQTKLIYETVKKLLPRKYGPNVKVRLLGVKASNLFENEESQQLSLLEDDVGEKMSASSEAVDKIRNRYGSKAIKLAGTKL
ncbi:MAG: DNA polymerase IV [candidate division Zixibacteria bacterium]|nr:DNA polymerase IV [candidate division Zixibacteria bacterium]